MEPKSSNGKNLQDIEPPGHHFLIRKRLSGSSVLKL